jgi:signal transduction histidine kinase
MNEKVLVIDDELGPRESLRFLLKNDYDVLCADSVDEGVRALKAGQPDVVIMDIRMPKKTGIEGLKEIRAVDPHVSVIMLTGYAKLETAQEALREGATDYLKKPFETAEMQRVVRQAVQRTRVERRRAAAARDLEQLTERLSSQLLEKEHMASAIGQASAEFVHDLKSPLMVVHGYVGLLGKQMEGIKGELGDHFPDALAYLDVIEKNVKRCSELVDTWQNLGRRDPRRMKRVSVPELLAEVVAGARPLAEEVGGTIRLDPPAEDLALVADGIQLFRAVQNVVRNAVQSLGGSGGQVVVSGVRSGEGVEIRVADNGCGIPPEQAAHLFEPYRTTKQPDRGMGLGLFITKKVIDDHAGTIRVESRVGRGTAVTMRLPLSPPAAASAA